ncbi:MAG TPA: hypothetical protein VN253_10585 [Kofleriaceae bacterium]|nr:hypothetical protein [Kofleriaceae bacterium]
MSNVIVRRLGFAVTVIATFWLGSSRANAQEAETETARVLPVGVVAAGVGFELQTSGEGTESAIPTIVEGGIANRLELVVEQVALTAIRPKTGTSATGLGDLEVTLVGLALHERTNLPAIALAAELKVPTARNQLIGTRQPDYTSYLILSKRFGHLDMHFNASYAIIGKPEGIASVDNIFGFGLLARYYLGKADLYAEVLGHTAAIPEVEGMDSAAELSGSELFGTLGAGYWMTPWLQAFFCVSFDNNQAMLFHPGITIKHKLF